MAVVVDVEAESCVLALKTAPVFCEESEGVHALPAPIAMASERAGAVREYAELVLKSTLEVPQSIDFHSNYSILN